jgi:hypothetical protein
VPVNINGCLPPSPKKKKLSATKAGQTTFKETITDMLDRQMKDIMPVVKKEAQNLQSSTVNCG